jgi:molybdopterin converting factor subunit 1
MRVKVLYFGILKELVGTADETIDLPDGLDVRGLLDILRRQTSKNGMEERVWQSLAVAVNREYSALHAVLCEGDEVALLPPVSGGCCAQGERLASLAKAFTGKKVR